MKKLIVLFAFLCAAFLGNAQSQHMKFLGVDLNCTMTTFVSKLKGKGFVQDMNGSHDNTVIMKGMFAGEKVKLEIRASSKTHLICSVAVCFNMSTRYTYEVLKKELQDKYGADAQEFNKLKEEDVYTSYVTDYVKWNTDRDTITDACNVVVLSKCSYRGSSPYVISYIDTKNSIIDAQEIKSDF